MTVDGNSTLNGDLIVGGNQTVNGNSYIKGVQVVEKGLAVGGDTVIAGNTTVLKDINVKGNANIAGTITADRMVIGGTDVGNELKQLDTRIDKTGAQAAALAGLRPVEMDADDMWSVSAAYGNYKGENSAALGVFYKPDEKMLFSVGSTVGNSDNMFNVSASFALSKGKNIGMGKAAMMKKIDTLEKENATMKQADVQNKIEIAQLKAAVQFLLENHLEKEKAVVNQ